MTKNNLHEGVDLEMKMDFGCGYVIRVAGEDRLGGVMSGGDITVDENGFMHISESAIPDLAPSASVNKVGNITTLSVTDHNGSTSVEIYDGEKGDPGTPGTNGTDGKDGVSPLVDVAIIEGGHRVSITDASGTQSFDVMDGVDGKDGASGTAESNVVIGVTDTITFDEIKTAYESGKNVILRDYSGENMLYYLFERLIEADEGGTMTATTGFCFRYVGHTAISEITFHSDGSRTYNSYPFASSSGSGVQKYSGTFSLKKDDSEETINCGFKPDVVFLNANDGMNDTGNVVWYTAVDFEGGEGTTVLTATDTGFTFYDNSSYSLALAFGSNGTYDSVSFLAVKF